MKTALGYRRLAQVQDWEKLAQDARFQPATLARLNFVSLRHLERFFLAQFHQSPGEWSRALKCRLARELIARGLPNKAVVDELGFANQSHLCHEFKRFLGASPQSFSPLARPARSAPTVFQGPAPSLRTRLAPSSSSRSVAFKQLNALAPFLPTADVPLRSRV